MTDDPYSGDDGVAEVTLNDAARGADLFATVEAAQYARVIDPVDPADADQEREIAAFVELFCDCAESWDEKAPMEQTASLGQLDDRIAALGEAGLRVYWAVPERRFVTQQGDAVTLPVAVLKIYPADAPAPTAHIPLVLGPGAL